MKVQTLVAVAGALFLFSDCSRGQSADEPQPAPIVAGRYSVRVADFDWVDPARRRSVPAKTYFPGETTSPCPVIILSHCLGGSKDDYGYLGRAWAAAGYVSVHLQHRGSDSAERRAIRPKNHLRQAYEDPTNTVQRAEDVRFAINQLEQLQRGPSPLAGRLDLGRIGVAGHSFGSLTVLNIAGQLLPSAAGPVSLADARVKAGLAMSTPIPARETLATVYAPIRVPILHMTGTNDDSPISPTRASDRRIPYDRIQKADQYLVTFRGADHMVFVGHKLPRRERQDPVVQPLVVRCSLLFWDAYLKENTKARLALADGELKNLVGLQALVEWKLAGPPPLGGM